jgi:hypothetical protein
MMWCGPWIVTSKIDFVPCIWRVMSRKYKHTTELYNPI